MSDDTTGEGAEAALLAPARAALASGPLCDSCLGRLFAERSFGLSNAERGKALRVTIALADDEPHEPADGCWVCEDFCARFEEFAEGAVANIGDVEFDTYQVGTKVLPLIEENELLLREEAGLPEDAGEQFKSEFNREVGKRVGRITGAEVEFGRPDVQILIDLASEDIDAGVNSAFVYGRYRKLERDIPQTEWPCRDCNATGYQNGEECPGCDGTGYRYDESVEQLVAPHVEDAMDGIDSTFHGAGREDVDALMLGTGRPFVVEVERPRRRHIDVEAVQEEINETAAGGKAEVEGLRLATYDMVERVKELDASKTYRASVEFDEPVTEDEFRDALAELDGATIEQETPQRVAHRRAALTRTREVYDIEGVLEDETHATVKIDGEGGLYIKELISSDEGRTTPSLAGLLGVEATVTALDVLAVEGEDEAFEAPEFFRA